MSQPSWTFLGLVNRVLRNLRKPQISDVQDTSNSRVAKDVIELVQEEYQEICGRQDWHWLRASAHLTVEAEVNTTATLANATVAFSSVASLPSYATFVLPSSSEGQVRVKAGAYDEIYTVQEYASILLLPIDREYNGEDATTADITIFKDRYDLPSNFVRFITINKYFSNSEIRLVGMQEFRKRQFEEGGFGIAAAFGPKYATLTEEREIIFWPWPKEKRSYQYDYTMEPPQVVGNDDTFLIPRDDMTVLLHRVMMIAYGYVEDDTRAGMAAQLYTEKYDEMSGSKTQVDDFVQLHAINIDRQRHSRSRRGRYGYSKGKLFDRS
jgi:hypothetical protein